MVSGLEWEEWFRKMFLNSGDRQYKGGTQEPET